MSHRTTYFVILIVAAAAISWSALVAVYEIASRGDQQSHILLILPVSAVLLYSDRHKVFRRGQYCLPAAVIFVSAGAASIWMASHVAILGPSGALSLRMAFFVGCCIAAFALCYGTLAFRVAAFPLLFLFFLAPVPDFVMDRTIWLLQKSSTDATVLLLKAVNIPVLRDGFVLSLPAFDIEVARECSGIRSSLTLLVVAVVLGHLFIRSNWRRALLLLLVFPIAVARNGLRIFALSALATLVDPSYLTGNFHRYGGIPLFALSLGVLMLIIWWLRKTESGAPKNAVQPGPSSNQNPDLVPEDDLAEVMGSIK